MPIPAFFYFVDLKKEQKRLEQNEKAISNDLEHNTKELDRLNEAVTNLQCSEQVNEQELGKIKQQQEDCKAKVAKLNLIKKQVGDEKALCEKEIQRMEQAGLLQSARKPVGKSSDHACIGLSDLLYKFYLIHFIGELFVECMLSIYKTHKMSNLMLLF